MTARRGRVLKLLLGASVLLLVLQSVAQGLLNGYARREFGPGAGTFQVRLWRLAVLSEKGSASLGELGVTWRGARFALLAGRLEVEALSLSHREELLAEVHGAKARQLYGSAVVQAQSVRLDLTRTGWEKVSDRWLKGESTPPGETPEPFALWLPTIDLKTPMGEVAGELSAWSDSGRWMVSGGAQRDGETHLHAEGTFAPDGGELFLNGSLFGRPLLLEAREHGGLWSLAGGVEAPEAHWAVDGRVSGADRGEILLRNRMPGRESEWLLASWSKDWEGGRVIPALATGEGGVALTSLGLGHDGPLSRWKLTVGTSNMNLIKEELGPCIFASVFSGASGLETAPLGHEVMNVNWNSGGGATLSLSASYTEAQVPLLHLLGGRSSLSAVLEGFMSPPMTLRGGLDTALIHLQLHGEGTGQSGSAYLLCQGRPGRWTGTLLWSDSRWQGDFEGAFQVPMDPSVPLPAGPWTLRGRLSGDGLRLREAALDGEANGGGKLEARFDGAALGVRFDGSPWAEWGGLQGASIELKGPWDGSFEAIGPLSLQGRSAGLKAGGFRAQSLRVQGTVSADSLSLNLAADLPDMGGRASGRIAGPLASPGALSLTEGRLELLDGALIVEELAADGFFAAPGQYALWRAPRAQFKGEALTVLSGRLVTSDPGGELLLEGSGSALGGRLDLTLRPSAGDEALRVEGRALDAKAVDRAVVRFQSLPFTAVAGSVDLDFTAPLSAPGQGWHIKVMPRDATLWVPDERHQFRGVRGSVLLALTAQGADIGSEGLSLEGGKVPVALGGALTGEGGAVRFAIAPTAAKEVQNALFDFLPEFIGYGEVMGQLGLEGTLVPPGREAGLLRIRALLKGADFRSEDGALRLERMDGALALSIPVGGEGPALRGYRTPGPEGTARALDRFSDPLLPGDLLQVGRIAFSVYHLENATLSSADGADGMTRLRMTRGRLWDGDARAEFALAVGAREIRYAGQVLLARASLREFCIQSEGMTGSLSGRFSAAVTFAADRLGLGALKALVAMEVDPEGGEPLLLGRDFLTKVGGEAMRKLVTRTYQPYDQASLQAGVQAGNLTVRSLVLEHRANPLQASIRRDLSFELKMPANSSISLYHLLDLVKNIEGTSVQVGPP